MDDDLRIGNLDPGFSERFHQPESKFTFDRAALAWNGLSADLDDDPLFAEILDTCRVHWYPDEIFPGLLARDISANLVDDAKDLAQIRAIGHGDHLIDLVEFLGAIRGNPNLA